MNKKERAEFRELLERIHCDQALSEAQSIRYFKLTQSGQMISLLDRIDKLEEALIWCSAAPSFQPEGSARIGWERLAKPLIGPEAE